MKKLIFVIIVLLLIAPVTKAFSSDFSWAWLFSQNNYYESSAQTQYLMQADVGVTTDQYDVYMYVPSWSPQYQNTKLNLWAPWSGSYDYYYRFNTAPGPAFEGRDVFFYIDESINGQPDPSDPARYLYHAVGTYHPLDVVSNVNVYGGSDVSVSWQGITFGSDGYADSYRVRIYDDSGNIPFDSGTIPINASNLYDYYLGDLSQYGPNISIAIEAREYVDQYGCANRSRYYASVSQSPVPEPTAMLLLGSGLLGLAGFGRKKFQK